MRPIFLSVDCQSKYDMLRKTPGNPHPDNATDLQHGDRGLELDHLIDVHESTKPGRCTAASDIHISGLISPYKTGDIAIERLKKLRTLLSYYPELVSRAQRILALMDVNVP